MGQVSKNKSKLRACWVCDVSLGSNHVRRYVATTVKHSLELGPSTAQLCIADLELLRAGFHRRSTNLALGCCTGGHCPLGYNIDVGFVRDLTGLDLDPWTLSAQRVDEATHLAFECFKPAACRKVRQVCPLQFLRLRHIAGGLQKFYQRFKLSFTAYEIGKEFICGLDTSRCLFTRLSNVKLRQHLEDFSLLVVDFSFFFTTGTCSGFDRIKETLESATFFSLLNVLGAGVGRVLVLLSLFSFGGFSRGFFFLSFLLRFKLRLFVLGYLCAKLFEVFSNRSGGLAFFLRLSFLLLFFGNRLAKHIDLLLLGLNLGRRSFLFSLWRGGRLGGWFEVYGLAFGCFQISTDASQFTL